MTTAATCPCSLCRERAGLQPPPPPIVYEKPKARAYGEPCTCRHCEALRAEYAEFSEVKS